jgi:hypothetical protein
MPERWLRLRRASRRIVSAYRLEGQYLHSLPYSGDCERAGNLPSLFTGKAHLFVTPSYRADLVRSRDPFSMKRISMPTIMAYFPLKAVILALSIKSTFTRDRYAEHHLQQPLLFCWDKRIIKYGRTPHHGRAQIVIYPNTMIS